MRGVRRISTLLLLAAAIPAPARAGPFRFVVLGDRTGETQPGVYEQVWHEAAAENPAFVIAVGDTIQGADDATAGREWQAWQRIVAPFHRIPLYLVPGNHDIWSAKSERLFRKYAGRALHYSFDYHQAHFTILDNSRSEDFSAEELAFLEKDLAQHRAQPLKFVFSHRPSWLISAVLRNPDFPVQRLARKYGLQYVIAGHVHEMLHVDLEDVSYVSMPSAGGHLRGARKYEDGWFFGYALVEVNGAGVSVQVKELKPPHGKGRVTKLEVWGVAGLAGKTTSRK
ncbi:MAG TPA: metallophosphoesterase [Bryobacteraceae bacterium]|nr:metallophosphoesterase [Bryobacteraceae bacterium]